jgi:hypothetical protein
VIMGDELYQRLWNRKNGTARMVTETQPEAPMVEQPSPQPKGVSKAEADIAAGPRARPISEQQVRLVRAQLPGMAFCDVANAVEVTDLELLCIDNLCNGLNAADAASWVNELTTKFKTNKECLRHCRSTHPEREHNGAPRRRERRTEETNMSKEHIISPISYPTIEGEPQKNYGCTCQIAVGDYCPEIEKKLLAEGNSKTVAWCLSLRPVFAPAIVEDSSVS